MEWLEYAVKLRESGMPLADLAELAALVRSGPGNERDHLAILDAHLRRVEAQIRALEESRALIEWKVEFYGDHLRSGRATGLWDPVADAAEAAGEKPEDIKR